MCDKSFLVMKKLENYFLRSESLFVCTVVGSQVNIFLADRYVPIRCELVI